MESQTYDNMRSSDKKYGDKNVYMKKKETDEFEQEEEHVGDKNYRGSKYNRANEKYGDDKKLKNDEQHVDAHYMPYEHNVENNKMKNQKKRMFSNEENMNRFVKQEDGYSKKWKHDSVNTYSYDKGEHYDINYSRKEVLGNQCIENNDDFMENFKESRNVYNIEPNKNDDTYERRSMVRQRYMENEKAQVHDIYKKYYEQEENNEEEHDLNQYDRSNNESKPPQVALDSALNKLTP